jgi:hypothetical protein
LKDSKIHLNIVQKYKEHVLYSPQIHHKAKELH